MRVVRVLMYEGPEDVVRNHLNGSNLLLVPGPACSRCARRSSLDTAQEHQTKTFQELGIREVFRGQLSEPGKVFFVEDEKPDDSPVDDAGHPINEPPRGE